MDWSAVIPAVIGGLIALAGVVSTQLVALKQARLTDERTLDRERKLRELEAATLDDHRSRDFQRETLLSLHEALQMMARQNGRALFFDHMQARRGELTQLPEDLSDAMLANTLEVTRLAQRVLDDSVRESVVQFVQTCAELTMAPTGYQGLRGVDVEDRAESLTRSLTTAWDRVNGTLGAAIRGYLAP